MRHAEMGIENLMKAVDTLVIIPNERLCIWLMKRLPF